MWANMNYLSKSNDYGIYSMLTRWMVMNSGYPFCITLNASLYSKVIGNLPQVMRICVETFQGFP